MLVAVSAVLVLLQALLFRWNVVIGGQLVPRSLDGLGTFTPSWTGREGLLPAAGILMLPLLTLWVLERALSPWDRGEEKAVGAG